MNYDGVPLPTKGGKLYGYARASDDSQENTPDAQMDRLRECAAYHKVPIVLEDQWGPFIDVGISALKLDFEVRPVGRRILALLGDGDVLIAWSRDRVFRRPGQRTVEKLAAMGVQFATLRESIDYYSPVGKMIGNIQDATAQYEGEMIGQRTREVMAYRTQQGLPNNGQTAFGKRRKHTTTAETGNVRAVYEPDEADMALIARAATMRKQGLYCRQIAAIFREEGHRTNNGNRFWSLQRISRATTWWWKEFGIKPPKHAMTHRPMLNGKALLGRRRLPSSPELGVEAPSDPPPLQDSPPAGPSGCTE